MKSRPAKSHNLSFDNTEIAFRGKSNADLTRAYWLFKFISIKFLTKIGPPITNVALKLGLPIKSMIKATIFRQFCGEKVLRIVNKLLLSSMQAVWALFWIIRLREKMKKMYLIIHAKKS